MAGRSIILILSALMLSACSAGPVEPAAGSAVPIRSGADLVAQAQTTGLLTSLMSLSREVKAQAGDACDAELRALIDTTMDKAGLAYAEGGSWSWVALRRTTDVIAATEPLNRCIVARRGRSA